jgi:LemA protein
MRKTGNIVLIVILVILVIVGMQSCGRYNSLVAMQTNVAGKWSQVQNDYQSRADMVDQLVNTVKGAANYEKSTLEAVVNARAKAFQVNVDASQLTQENIDKFQKAQSGLTAALNGFRVIQEQYPDLKANRNFSDLMAAINGNENKINISRKDYNEAVQQFNTAIHTFPSNIYAGMFNFHDKPFFNADTSAQKRPNISF